MRIIALLKKSLFTAVLMCFASSSLLAQHDMHNMNNAESVDLTTMPANNEVLATAPGELMLHFGSATTLVKLVLKDQDAKFIDIDFRFDPTPSQHFAKSLPALEQRDYYTVEWATLDAVGELVKGNFYFSFGENAQPPSYYLEQLEHPIHIMAPDYRLL